MTSPKVTTRSFQHLEFEDAVSPSNSLLPFRAIDLKPQALLNPSEAEEDTATSTGGYTDFEASDHNDNISRSGSVCGYNEGEDEDGDEDEDTDGSIARLFSLDGLKRTRNTPESRSSTAGARSGQTPTTRAFKRGRPSSTASFDLQAEAFLDWTCVRCTLINPYDQESCQGCGSANVKRNKLMRERRMELKRRGRLQAERECRNRSLKEEALKDVLEDSDADDERASSVTSTTSAKEGSAPSEELPGTVESTCHNDSSREHSASGKSPSGSMAKASASVAAGSGSQVHMAHGEDGIRGEKHRCACFVSMLPPDLLLQCAEFLGDSRSLCRAREVSRGWLLALDDREAGLRLWRPMFYRLRASGTIHAATNARGQRRHVPKQYDLGTLPTMDLGACSAPPGDGSGVSTAGATLGGAGRPSGRQTDALLRRSSSCLVCGLIQREGYAGNDCEMCASSLVIVDHRESPAAPPRVAYTRVQLSESCGTSASPTPPRPSEVNVSRTSGAPAPDSVVTRERSSGVLPRNCEGARSGEDQGEGTDIEVDVDWHFLVKRMAEEKRIAAGWGSLHQGWVWLQGALQAMLHQRLGNEQSCSAALGAERRAGTEGSSFVSSPGLGAASCSAGNEGQSELEPRIARVVRKLASKKWVVLYDSLKTMFTLQAEGIARGVVFEVLAAGISVAVLRAAGRETEAQQTGEVAELDGLRRCVRAWEAYKDWGEEVDMYCELLNEQISGERYRGEGTSAGGCGRGDQTPFVRHAALLSFRHSFALNVQVCALLREAIFKGMAAMGVEATGAQGRKHGDHGARAAGASAGVVEGTGTGTGNGRACSVEVEDSIFTDLELMEDSRAIDFTVRSFSRPNIGGRSTGSSFAPGALGRSRGSKPTHYYDWFLSKLEGKEAGIIRGDIDARGKRVERQNVGQDGKNPINRAEKGGADGSGSAPASLEELLDLVRDMVEELDVRDDGLSKDRPTQGAMRRLLVLPIKRWQAAVSEASAEDPRNMMLMAGLSPSPGNDGFHRLREGAAGRRKGKPRASTFRKNAGKSWEELSAFFG